MWQQQYQCDWEPRDDPPSHYMIGANQWFGEDNPLRLAWGMPDVDRRVLVPRRDGRVPERRFRWLAAELFRWLAPGGCRPTVASHEFAEAIYRADWLDRDLPCGWDRPSEDQPDYVRKFLWHIAVGPMTHREVRIAEAWLHGMGDRRNGPVPRTVRSPSCKTGVTDLVATIGGESIPRDWPNRTGPAWWRPMPSDRDVAMRIACDLIREAFRGPEPPSKWPTFRPEWRTDTVLSLRKQMRADPQQLAATPILADALQDAGCDDADLLEHLRVRTAHTRGCWALEAIGS